MPRYKVISPGFHDSKYYHPEGKRPVLETAKPFPKKKMPAWLAPMPAESAAVKEKRERYEAEEKHTNEHMVASGHKDVAKASSTGDGKAASFLDKVVEKVTGGSKVETL